MIDPLRARLDLVPLGRWIVAAEAARIPYVPAKFSPKFPVEQLWRYLDGEGDTRKLEIAFAWLEYEKGLFEAAGERWMARWECCTSGNAKSYASGGVFDIEAVFQVLSVDDPRLADCTVGCEETRIAVRPWMQPMMVLNYPLEFRVFFGADGLQGVSSYYPQRPVPNTGFVREAITNAVKYAGLLEEQLKSPVGFTADFLVMPEGTVLFLEGGPPHVDDLVSAHPCCFAPGKIVGIALEQQEGR